MSSAVNLPSLTEQGLSAYLEKVNKFPILSFEEEQKLARAWLEQQDIEAAEKLVTSHLRLVAKMAMGFRGYGLPVSDLISEGNIGLMQAVKKFDPDKGFRLSTYAMWWIKASINEYILRSWSLVKMGTTAAQKKLFFNLKKLKGKITNADRNLTGEEISQIANDLNVPEKDVVEMDERLYANDSSLNKSVSYNNGDDGGQLIDFVEDENINQEDQFLNNEASSFRSRLLEEALGILNEREQDIIKKRHIVEPHSTLEDLSKIYGVSKERIRQIEARALEKMQVAVKKVEKSNLIEC